MAVTFSDGYASPTLRKAVFDKLHPGAVVEYDVMSIEDAFPLPMEEDDSGAEFVVRCTVICADGSYYEGFKEIPKRVFNKKTNKWEDRPLTVDAWYADTTKALGHAMRDAGMPMSVPPLKLLMDYLWPRPVAPKPERANRETGEIEGEPRELTLEQQVAVMVADMSGPEKAALATWAKKEHNVGNLMKAGEHARAVFDHIESGSG